MDKSRVGINVKKVNNMVELRVYDRKYAIAMHGLTAEKKLEDMLSYTCPFSTPIGKKTIAMLFCYLLCEGYSGTTKFYSKYAMIGITTYEKN